MIKIDDLTKRFGNKTALDHISLDIKTGSVLGVTGSNGAGKSTLLRLMAGVLNPDSGTILIDGIQSYDNASTKKRCYFVPDFPFYYNDSTLLKMRELYSFMYPKWDDKIFNILVDYFGLSPKMRFVTMSKGMQRQAALIVAFSAQTDYVFLDEIFDGLDPVNRQKVKKVIVGNVEERDLTCLIASHNLRELDDICSDITVIHEGKLLQNREVNDFKQTLHRIQIAFAESPKDDFLTGLDVVNKKVSGNYYLLTLRGDIEQIEGRLKALDPVFYEVVPLSLEEIFISEMGGAGHEI